eukprot:scaffold101527_cov63-Phaeocystis_antarctica.AAC.1
MQPHGRLPVRLGLRCDLPHVNRLLSVLGHLRPRQVDPRVAQPQPRRHAATHGAACERVEHGPCCGAEPAIHELA